MTLGAIRVSALALGGSALTLFSPLPVANAATVVHHPAIHGRVTYAHGRHTVHHYAHHYVRGHRYAYGNGYNPGAAAAVGVIGGILGAGLAGAYDCGGYGYGCMAMGPVTTTATAMDTGRITAVSAMGIPAMASARGMAATAMAVAMAMAATAVISAAGPPASPAATSATASASAISAAEPLTSPAATSATWAALAAVISAALVAVISAAAISVNKPVASHSASGGFWPPDFVWPRPCAAEAVRQRGSLASPVFMRRGNRLVGARVS